MGGRREDTGEYVAREGDEGFCRKIGDMSDRPQNCNEDLRGLGQSRMAMVWRRMHYGASCYFVEYLYCSPVNAWNVFSEQP
jgi:hypothetical protein